ncbi:hypothetical protein M407DRAFT_133126 [Tulasnella calospora MUT 4182]|uniref:Uncharacterized protein n=1 Tax=Tulasnella calospora MUT 4182 TaxID=1051891 RepID=A0A0C3LHC8_9AGAM|nr:hypothetical protein M407DRAFT_133126 [Tulasnella calospora MUT 4182]
MRDLRESCPTLAEVWWNETATESCCGWDDKNPYGYRITRRLPVHFFLSEKLVPLPARNRDPAGSRLYVIATAVSSRPSLTLKMYSHLCIWISLSFSFLSPTSSDVSVPRILLCDLSRTAT